MSALEQQLRKLFRHVRQGSFGTRARYQTSCLVFAQYLHKEFKLQNFLNIHDGHIVAFIRQRQSEGISSKTLKNDLCAIRFAHDQLARPRYRLSGNDLLKQRYDIILDKTPSVRGNRAWAEVEYTRFLELARAQAREDIHCIIILCRGLGFRITEVAAMARSQAEWAVRAGEYLVRSEGKNGRWRTIPVNQLCYETLKNRMEKIPRGGWMFLPAGKKTHLYVGDLERWLMENRQKAETSEGRELRTWVRDGKLYKNELTWHGLRYLFAQDRAKENGVEGQDLNHIARDTAIQMGHGRLSVLKIYGITIPGRNPGEPEKHYLPGDILADLLE